MEIDWKLNFDERLFSPSIQNLHLIVLNGVCYYRFPGLVMDEQEILYPKKLTIVPDDIISEMSIVSVGR